MVRGNLVVHHFVALLLHAAYRVVADNVVYNIGAVAPCRSLHVRVEGKAILLQILGKLAAGTLHLLVGTVVIKVAGNDEGFALFYPFFCCGLDDGTGAAPCVGRKAYMQTGKDVIVELCHQHATGFAVGCKRNCLDAERHFLAEDSDAVARESAAEYAVHTCGLSQFLNLIFVVGA